MEYQIVDFSSARAGVFVAEFVGLFMHLDVRPTRSTQRHQDLAASAQVVLEETLLHLGRHLRSLTRAESLCMAGRSRYNCGQRPPWVSRRLCAARLQETPGAARGCCGGRPGADVRRRDGIVTVPIWGPQLTSSLSIPPWPMPDSQPGR